MRGSGDAGPSLALAISTVGRATLDELLASAAVSTRPPDAVAVADHSPRGDLRVRGDYPFEVLVVPSTGGASRGRNDAHRALGRRFDVVGFPNDDNTYPPRTLEQVVERFAVAQPPAALACALVEHGSPRFRLPPAGTVLDRHSVWRAVEPAMFLSSPVFERHGGFRDDMGTGAQSPWQSGDGTDLLLRIQRGGGRVVSAADCAVLGRGERKGLTPEALVAKHRAYARGTGYVYRSHGYALPSRVRVLAGPLLKAGTHDPSLSLSLRLAVARTVGRYEGLRGRPLRSSAPLTW